MKWLFLLMVLANAGFVAWQGFSASDIGAEQAPVYAPPVGERIYLVGEKRPDEEVVPVSAPPTPTQKVVNEVDQAVVNALQEQNNDAQKAEESLLCPVVTLERSADLSIVTEALDRENLSYTQNDITGKREKFWLYIPAPATSAQAQSIVSRLKLKRIDSYIISRGEMKNRISLGLFSSKARAEQAQVSISERSGMSVNVYPHQRSVKLYELLLDRPISEQVWDSFLKTLDLSKLLIKIEKNPC